MTKALKTFLLRFTKEIFLKHIWWLLLAIFGFVIILCFTHHGGIGISPDSIAYVSVARKVIEGYGLTGYNERPFVLFPLFYPCFLSVIVRLLDRDIVAVAPILNGILFALTVFLSAKMLQVNWWLKGVTVLCIVLSVALLEVYTMLWSETLFILLTIVFCLAINKYLTTKQLKYLIFSATLASIACVTRYAAITLLASGLLLLIIDRKRLFKNRVADCLIFGLIGISLLVANLLRNYLSTGILTGKRQPSITSFFKNVQYLGRVFIEWFTALKPADEFSLSIGLIILLGFSTLLIGLIYKKAQSGYLYTACGFFVVYAWFMVISSTISRYEPINSRLLSPLYVPFLVVFSGLIHKLADKYKSKFILAIGILTTLIFTAFQVNTDLLNYKDANEGGIGGYTEDSWKESPTLHYLLANKKILIQDDFTVYSNASQALYFYTNQSSDGLPERKYKDDVTEFNKEDEFYLVWFNFEDNKDLLNLKEIAQKNTMQVLNRFDDGVIYLCKARR